MEKLRKSLVVSTRYGKHCLAKFNILKIRFIESSMKALHFSKETYHLCPQTSSNEARGNSKLKKLAKHRIQHESPFAILLYQLVLLLQLAVALRISGISISIR